MDDTIAILNRIAAAEHADPASDDLTIPLAIECAEKDARISRLRAALSLISNHELRDHEDYEAIQDIATTALAHDGRKPG